MHAEQSRAHRLVHLFLVAVILAACLAAQAATQPSHALRPGIAGAICVGDVSVEFDSRWQPRKRLASDNIEFASLQSLETEGMNVTFRVPDAPPPQIELEDNCAAYDACSVRELNLGRAIRVAYVPTGEGGWAIASEPRLMIGIHGAPLEAIRGIRLAQCREQSAIADDTPATDAPTNTSIRR